jgi:acyl-CoA synthetase (AMP-forming)/AMP-acid ligase II
MYHIYGMQCIMNCGLYHGVTLITMPKYQLKDFLHVCQRTLRFLLSTPELRDTTSLTHGCVFCVSDYGVTRAYLVPPIILQLTKDPLVAQYDLSKLRVINSGAAPLGPELQAECQAKLNVIVKQGYGLTETSPTTHVTPDDPKTIKVPPTTPLIC